MALIALVAVRCPAEDEAGSIIGGLADIGDMEPLTDRGDDRAAATDAATPTASVKASIGANVRQSVPVRDRAATYRAAELFRNSKVALPLLVADLEPQVIFVPQPMSGRSVGARPSAPWTRP
ncbi:MAG: hypothetical protein EBX35_10545 [Planctomycetia bacterium]|nr:hypothetical protein [Planctomycetia bacterium]